MKLASKTVTVLLLISLLGCSNSLVVKGEFPKPLIEQQPHTVGLYYSDEFRNYTYVEANEKRHKWTISIGEAQVSLLNTVMSQMFTEATEVSTLPNSDLNANTELVFQPQVREFQYSVPRETHFKIFEVWIKYNISVFDHRGQLIADWIVTAYGKTPTAFMQSDEAAMNAAIVVALRDLGANLSLTTSRVPELQAWMQQHSKKTLPPVKTAKSKLNLEDEPVLKPKSLK